MIKKYRKNKNPNKNEFHTQRKGFKEEADASSPCLDTFLHILHHASSSCLQNASHRDMLLKFSDLSYENRVDEIWNSVA